MNLVTISLAYLKARKLNTLLNILLLALGVATIVLLLLATTQLDQQQDVKQRVELARLEVSEADGDQVHDVTLTGPNSYWFATRDLIRESWVAITNVAPQALA